MRSTARWSALAVCLSMLLTLLLAAPAMAQDGSPDVPPGTLAAAIAIALVPLLGWVSTKIYDGFKTIIPSYDKLPALVHQVAAPFIALALGWIAANTNVPVITDFTGVDTDWINGVLNGIVNATVASGIFRKEKKAEPRDATTVLEGTRHNKPEQP